MLGLEQNSELMKAIQDGAGMSKRDQEVLEVIGSGHQVLFRLANYFLVKKSPEEIARILISNGLEPVIDPLELAPEIRKHLYQKELVDQDGFFLFLPNRLVLGHTLESVIVPDDQSYYFRQYFIDKTTGQTLPLTTHWGAPSIRSGSRGRQTYEIINESGDLLKARVENLICVADIGYMTAPTSSQSRGKFTGLRSKQDLR